MQLTVFEYIEFQLMNLQCISENTIFNSLLACEPEAILAFPETYNIQGDKFRDVKILSNLYGQHLVQGVVDWAKQIPGFVDLTANDQNGLIKGTLYRLDSKTLAIL